MSNFWYYQNRYMEDRLGKDWGTNGGAICTNGYAEQTAFCSFIYASIRSFLDLF